MTYLRPGVYVEEISTKTAPLTGSAATSIAAFVGATDKGPTTPTLVTSWAQYTSIYGSWGTNDTVTRAIYLFFANGGSQAYVQRVVAGSPALATVTLKDTAGTPADTLTINAKNVGSWGNSLYVSIVSSSLGSDYFSVVVYSGGSADANVVERFLDVTMNKDSVYYAVNVINGGSNYIAAVDASLSDTYNSSDNPATCTATVLTSGSNGTAPTTANIASAISGGALDSIDNALLLNAPGVTAQADVDPILAYAAGRKDVFVIIDGINDTAANQITLVNTYSTANAAYGAVYFPQLVIPNPTQASTGATITVPPGGAVIGRIVTTDASRGVFKSPAGLDARLSGVVSVNNLTNTELDNLNSNNAAINAIRYIPGSGIVVMGARTLKPGYENRYISVRRSLIYLRKQADDLTKFGLFEPNDFRLWSRIESTLQAFLTDFWQQGGLAGNTPSDAFYVKCDEENNTDLTVANGQVIAEIGVALQRPAEFIVIRISQYDGGAVVTIS